MNNKNKNYKINQSIQKNSYKRPIIIVFVCLIVIFVIGYFFYAINKTDEVIINDAKTTSTSPSAQESYSDGDDRPVLESNLDEGQASVSDTQGIIQTTPSQSEWSTSKSGEITVYSPSKDQIVQNRAVLSGESSLQVISYRIIDNVSGMINEGQLTVVNGKFSGSLSFNTSASEGRIDVFGLNDSGSEFSNVEILIRFK